MRKRTKNTFTKVIQKFTKLSLGNLAHEDKWENAKAANQKICKLRKLRIFVNPNIEKCGNERKILLQKVIEKSTQLSLGNLAHLGK